MQRNLDLLPDLILVPHYIASSRFGIAGKAELIVDSRGYSPRGACKRRRRFRRIILATYLAMPDHLVKDIDYEVDVVIKDYRLRP